MKERPILFKGEMVKAILDGTKTQTRRVVKPQPWSGTQGYQDRYGQTAPDGLWHPYDYPNGDGKRAPCDDPVRCPYGQPGDRLWVRETWAPMWSVDCDNCEDEPSVLDEHGHCPHFYVEYKADTGNSRPGDWPDPEPNGDFADAPAWKPSIHMFRWASRIDLANSRVRVERLQDISEEDAKAEGVIFDGTYWLGGIHPVKKTLQCWPTARRAFQALWDSINGTRPGCSWDDNPWLWVVDYKRIRP